MLARTHLAFGILVFLVGISILDIGSKLIFFIAVLFFSIIPDIDSYESNIGKKFRPFSYIINFILKHRGIFHTIYFPILLYFLFDLVNADLALGALLGYCSHIVLDSMTLAGTKPFYPIYNKKIRGFFKSGGFFEFLLFILIIIIGAYELISR